MQGIFREQELAPRQPSARRQKLSPKLLSDERFIDPAREAELLLPQQLSSQLLVESQGIATSRLAARQQKQSLISSLYEQFVAWLAWVKRKFKGSAQARRRLTAQGEMALDQLRYLSLLCDATEARTPDEALCAQSAFGEAYYEIMSLSSNLIRMSQKEQEHHLRRYQGHMASVLRSTL